MRVLQRIPLKTMDLEYIQQCTKAVEAVTYHIGVLLCPFLDRILRAKSLSFSNRIPRRRYKHRNRRMFLLIPNLRIQVTALVVQFSDLRLLIAGHIHSISYTFGTGAICFARKGENLTEIKPCVST